MPKSSYEVELQEGIIRSLIGGTNKRCKLLEGYAKLMPKSSYEVEEMQTTCQTYAKE